MAFLKKMSKSQKIEYAIVFSIFVISIIVGNIVGQNTEWFRPAFSTAGYMAGSLMTCLLLFSLYRAVEFFMQRNKTTE